MSVAGFGSLLSERSARTTFPNLINFRMGRVCLEGLSRACMAYHNTREGVGPFIPPHYTPPHHITPLLPFPLTPPYHTPQLRGYRRVFAHCADIFYARGIARPETGEVSSLSCEPSCEPEQDIIVAVFEVQAGGSEGFVEAFIQREHEFRFVAVEPENMDGSSMGRLAVCGCGCGCGVVGVWVKEGGCWVFVVVCFLSIL